MVTLARTGAFGVALALAAVSEKSLAAEGGRLLVFLQLAVKQRALQGALQESLAGVSVTAVGRIGDFERAVQQGQDAVLTLPLVLAANGLAPKVQGFRNAAPDEAYVLVGVSSPPDPQKVKSVGALDFLGRDGTTSFINGLLGTQPKVERVTKVEDLLPLLQMDIVESVVMAARFLDDLRSTSRLSLAATNLSNRVALPAVAGVGPGAGAVLSALGQLPAPAMAMLGVDQWR